MCEYFDIEKPWTGKSREIEKKKEFYLGKNDFESHFDSHFYVTKTHLNTRDTI